ncbi:PAAR domain-containing protein [Marinobacter sp. LN3S78]|uniref:PAAR domain-containing protein n=1 Tax=Marinobacter sp. LN3S78 TaxID=3382300 RepID=UPI00387AC5C3
MGQPAATLNCYHTCPDKTGKKDHVGGPIVAGSSNVMVGALPAARVGDKLVCRGPADAIAKGSSSVSINGISAARVNDMTAHGGKIVVGNPTVVIGDAGVSVTPDSGGGGVAKLDMGKGSGAGTSGRSSAVSGEGSAPYSPMVNLDSQRAAILKGTASCPVCEAVKA